MGAKRIFRNFGALREALVRGDHADLGALVARIEADIVALKPGGLPEADLRRLRQETDRHADLLLAARDGIRAARERIAAMGSVPQLRTYGQNGQASVAPSDHGGKLFKRR